MAKRHARVAPIRITTSADATRYDAFISYSHALDDTLAPALQRGLERFAKPWYRARALRVFRDDASMSASPDLWSTIEQALHGSAWLVLMASPDAARSPWVNQEVAWWLDHKSSDRLLVVLTEGEFGYSGSSEPDPSAALPPSLRGAFTGEPRWVDLRWLHDSEQVAQSNPRLRDGVADIAAALHAVPKDDLVGEHIRQHRRTMRLARSAVALLLVLLLIAVSAALYARDRQTVAESSARTATARLLGTRADAALGSDPRLALQLGLAAQAVNPGGEAHAGLVASLTATRYAGILTGHRDGVRALAVAPNRPLLASGSNDGTAILWDLTDPDRPRQLSPPLLAGGGTVDAVAFDPARPILALGTLTPEGHDGALQLWDITDPGRPSRIGQPIPAHRGVTTLGFAPHGQVLVSGGEDHALIVWDPTDPAHPKQLSSPFGEPNGPVPVAAFGGDGTLFTSGSDGQIVAWDLTDPTLPRALARPTSGQLGAVGSLAVAPETNLLVALGLKGAVSWDVSDREHPRAIGSIESGRSIASATFAPGGRMIALAGADRTVSVWDISDPARPSRIGDPLTGHKAVVRTAAFTRDGQRVLTGSDDGTIMLWNVVPPTQPRPAGPQIAGPGGPVASFACDAAGRLLATADSDGGATLWEIDGSARPRPLGRAATGYRDPPTTIALTDDGRTMATASSTDYSIQLWDTSAPERIRPLGPPRPAHESTVNSALFLPGNRDAVTASIDGKVTVWDLTDPAQASPLPVPTSGPDPTPVNALAASPNGRILVSAGDDGTVGLWDISTPGAVHPIRSLAASPSPVNGVSFSADGTTLAAASSDGSVALFDLRDPANPRPLGQPLRDIGGWILSVAFAPDRTLLATGSDDRTLTIFDLSDPTRPRRLGTPLAGPIGPARSLVFTPDGRFLISADDTSSVLLWSLAGLDDVREHAVATACARAGRGLTEREWSDADIDIIGHEDTCPVR